MNAIKRICSIGLALCLMVTCGFSAFAGTPDGLTDGVYEGRFLLKIMRCMWRSRSKTAS